jgi:hypothetical protein
LQLKRQYQRPLVPKWREERPAISRRIGLLRSREGLLRREEERFQLYFRMDGRGKRVRLARATAGEIDKGISLGD